MDKKIIFAGIIALLFIATASAETYDNSANLIINNTYRNQQFIWYDNSLFTNVGDEGINIYVSYYCNGKDTRGLIKNVTLELMKTPASLVNGKWINTTSEIDVINITTMSIPFPERKKFFTLTNKESLFVKMDTEYFENPQSDSICSFEVLLGTKQCSRCQEFEYYQFEQDVYESDVLESYKLNVKTATKIFFDMIYEFLIIFYYVILITIFIMAFGFVFYIGIWIFHLLLHWISKK